MDMDMTGKSFTMSEEEVAKVLALKDVAGEFIDALKSLPEGRSKLNAITFFETSLMWASNSIMGND